MSDWILGAAAGAIGAMVTYAVRALIGEAIRVEAAKRRQLHALAIDCLGTARQLSSVVNGVVEDRDNLSSAQSPNVESLMKFRSGWVLSKPTIGISIVELLDLELGMLVVRYLDRWERLLEYERRYAKCHQDLLVALTADAPKEALLIELWAQLSDNLREIEGLARGLAILAVDMFNLSYDPGCSDPEISFVRLSDGAWSHRGDLDDARRALVLHEKTPTQRH